MGQPQQGVPLQENKSELEQTMRQLTKNTNKFMADTQTNFQNQATQIQNLEVQVGQLANMLNGRQQGNLPCSTEVNPREQYKANNLEK